MVALGVLGLLLQLVLLATVVAIGIAWFASLAPAERRCPACGRDGLSRVDSTVANRLAQYHCAHCDTAFQEQLDGSLLMVEPRRS